MNSKPNWILNIDEEVFKALKRIPVKDQKRILQGIKSLTPDPFTGDVQKIKGEENVWNGEKELDHTGSFMNFILMKISFMYFILKEEPLQRINYIAVDPHEFNFKL